MKHNTKLKLNVCDILLIAFITLFSGWIYLKLYYWEKGSSSVAIVYLNNSIYGRYNLSQNRIISINEHATAEIYDGQIRMLRSDCPDKRCVKQGWSQQIPVICLPNKIEIELSHNKSDVHLLY